MSGQCPGVYTINREDGAVDVVEGANTARLWAAHCNSEAVHQPILGAPEIDSMIAIKRIFRQRENGGSTDGP